MGLPSQSQLPISTIGCLESYLSHSLYYSGINYGHKLVSCFFILLLLYVSSIVHRNSYYGIVAVVATSLRGNIWTVSAS